MAKFIFVTGGVVSGLGKGVTAASLGRLLKMRGLKVAAQKLDPYMNIDPGEMNPLQHGEVFITEDGAKTDLDLGHYERFIDENLNKFSNITSGKIYWSVLNKERAGEYLGDTVQVIPHITGEIKNFVYTRAKESGADIIITEIGGTAGDIESQPFLEAIRQIAQEVGRKNCLFIHVTLVPFLSGSNEHKSKPTQHSVKELQSLGIAPDIIVARSDRSIEENVRAKIALFCNVEPDCVIENLTLKCLYEAPLMLHKNGLDKVVCRELSLRTKKPDMSAWRDMVRRIKQTKKKVRIAIVGKYVRLHDAYLSMMEALSHAGYEYGTNIEMVWVDSENVTFENAHEIFKNCNAVLVPNGSGIEGVEGKIQACRYARENNVPFFGICFGMQMAVIEYARNVAKIENATSGEFDANGKNLVVDLLPEFKKDLNTDAAIRVGSYPCKIAAGSILERAYKVSEVGERHHHRYEINSEFIKALQNSGLLISGTSPDGRLVEAVEVKQNDFYLGVQFHPEFKSRPNRAHPLFLEFVGAAIKNQQKN